MRVVGAVFDIEAILTEDNTGGDGGTCSPQSMYDNETCWPLGIQHLYFFFFFVNQP